MSFTISISLIVLGLLSSCTVAQLERAKLRTLLSTTSHAPNFLPSDGNFEYRISYQDYYSNEYAIYSPPSYTHEQQWFHGADLLHDIKTSADNTFAITVDDYCLYHVPLINTMYQLKRFYWFDCTYNPYQTLEKRIATHYYRRQENTEFRVFFSFQNREPTFAHRIYDKITLSIRSSSTNNQESVTQIPIYCVFKKTDIKIDETTSPLDMFPWELRNKESTNHGMWKYQIMFDTLINQTVNNDNVSHSNHLLMPVTVSIQFV